MDREAGFRPVWRAWNFSAAAASDSSGRYAYIHVNQSTDIGSLVDGMKSGSRQAFSEAIRRYGPLVQSIVGSMLRDRRDVEEVVQDAFVGAFRDIGRFRPGGATFPTWLGRIAYHRAVDFMRRRNLPAGPLSELADIPADEEPDVERQFAVEEIGEALERLSPDERMLLTLVYFDELPLAEAAYIMQSNPAALSARLYRLRHKLARIINEQRKKRL